MFTITILLNYCFKPEFNLANYFIYKIDVMSTRVLVKGRSVLENVWLYLKLSRYFNYLIKSLSGLVRKHYINWLLHWINKDLEAHWTLQWMKLQQCLSKEKMHLIIFLKVLLKDLITTSRTSSWSFPGRPHERSSEALELRRSASCLWDVYQALKTYQEVFNAHTWSKDFEKHDWNVDPFHRKWQNFRFRA